MAKTKEPRSYAMRLDARMSDLVERYRKKLADAQPGQRVTASDAIRRIMEAGVSALSL